MMAYSESALEMRSAGIGKLLGRAFLLRCPRCGRGTLLKNWIRLRHTCKSCSFRFERGEHDHFLGAYLLNFIVAELLVVAGLVGIMLLTWPDVPWTGLTWGLILMVVPAPFITYPYSRAIWLALDLYFQPERPGDFAAET